MDTELPSHLLRNCEFKFACRKTWDSLHPLPGLNSRFTRHCDDCNQSVHLADSPESLLLHIEFNHCVAIPFEMTYRFQNLKHLSYTTLGVMKLR